MHGIPKICQSREDFDLVLEMARAGEADRRAVANQFAGLIESAKNYVFDRELKDGEAPDGDMPDYCVTEASEQQPKRVQLKLEFNLSRIESLGFALDEVRAIVSELEGK